MSGAAGPAHSSAVPQVWARPYPLARLSRLAPGLVASTRVHALLAPPTANSRSEHKTTTLNLIIFRPYFIRKKKIFKSNGFFKTQFAKHQIYIQAKGFTHRSQLT